MSNASTGSRACEFCYARKVKCIMTDSKVCRACKENRIECRQRETRRQAASDMSSARRSPPCAVRTDSAISIPEEDLNVSTMAPLQQQDPFAFFDVSTDLTNFSNPWDKSVYPSPPMSTSEPVPQQMYSPTSQMMMGYGQADEGGCQPVPESFAPDSRAHQEGNGCDGA
ncbi:---NA--- [Lecanosticta acicola]|uniref:---NA n=1 Tax=Lecanosticta acicola TaxID=111012 RepID=A0AAI8W2B4_9PEZI|nr:---NA--- [Lecanosticta acicola]